MFGKRKANTGTLRPWQDKVSQKIAGAINRIQSRWASWMDQAVNRLSIKGRKVALLCFCMLMGAASVLSIADVSIEGRPKIDNRMNLPSHTMPEPEPAIVLPDATADRIRQFRTYLDSLGKTQMGNKIRDSLLKSRPGLLDSLEKIEQYYQLQLNNH